MITRQEITYLAEWSKAVVNGNVTRIVQLRVIRPM